MVTGPREMAAALIPTLYVMHIRFLLFSGTSKVLQCISVSDGIHLRCLRTQNCGEGTCIECLNITVC